MTKIYLIRHGLIVKDTGPGDPPLAPLGMVQAKATAAYLKNRPIKKVYTSPLRRAKETAYYIAAGLGLEVSEDARLRERANWGDLPGQSYEAFIAMWIKCEQDRSFVPPVGDSAQQAGARIERFIEAIYQQYPNDEIVAVSHGGVILDFLLNRFTPEQLAQVNPDFSEQQGNLFLNCCVTLVSYEGGSCNLEMLAEAGHL
jgi:broad specificity phosphatase PhoE